MLNIKSSISSIPKVIIQTNKNPEIGSELRQTWINKHPGFDYKFFTDDDCKTFFREDYPNFLDTYNKLPMTVQKVDLFRYAYIYKHGGIYSDVDTICHVPIYEYVDLNHRQLVVGIEMSPLGYTANIDQYTKHYCSPLQILQWTFASSPKHPALKNVLERIRFTLSKFSYSDLLRCSTNNRFTLELTGPMLFTNVLLTHLIDKNKDKICLLKQNYWGFNPHHQTLTEKESLLKGEIKVEHLFQGSWRVKPDTSKDQPKHL